MKTTKRNAIKALINNQVVFFGIDGSYCQAYIDNSGTTRLGAFDKNGIKLGLTAREAILNSHNIVIQGNN